MSAAWISALGIGLVHAAVLLRAMLLKGREPTARAAWLFLLAALPVLGVILYLLFGEPWMSKRFRDLSRAAYEELLPFAPPATPEGEQPSPYVNALMSCEATSWWPAVGGNEGIVAPDPDAAIAMIVEDIDAAATTVHLSTYIWLTDGNGTKVAEAICRAAQRGVACRIVADAIGSRAMIRSASWRAMADAGARLCASLKAPFGLGFLTGRRADLRNHRKLVVIDGRITYCGSQNCADPAFRIKPRFAPWVDVMIRYEGPIARQAELIFGSAWKTETGEDFRPVVSTDPPLPERDGFDAIAVGTGPLSPRGAMTAIFVATLAAAADSATITTPYFAPDPPLIAAIIAAARRGVRVRIVFPHRNDNRVVGAIARAYYPDLADAGVHIFEFRGGLLHAKTILVDGMLGLVGSANMDRRSLDLNFENNVMFVSRGLAGQVADQQSRWLAQAVEIDHDAIAARWMVRRLVDNLLTMVAAVF